MKQYALNKLFKLLEIMFIFPLISCNLITNLLNFKERRCGHFMFLELQNNKMLNMRYLQDVFQGFREKNIVVIYLTNGVKFIEKYSSEDEALARIEEIRNKMLNSIDNKIEDGTKECISLPVWDSKNYKLSFKNLNGENLVIDLPLESLAKDINYDSKTKEIILIKEDNTEIRISINDLVDIYSGLESNTISVDVSSDNVISAELKDLSITKSHLSNDLKQEIENTESEINLHKSNIDNPHNVTKSQIGLSEVDNTSDLDKPISNAQRSELDLKQNITDISLLTSSKQISGAINELKTSVDNNEKDVQAELKEIKNTISSNKTEIEKDLSNNVTSINKSIDNLNNAVALNNSEFKEEVSNINLLIDNNKRELDSSISGLTETVNNNRMDLLESISNLSSGKLDKNFANSLDDEIIGGIVFSPSGKRNGVYIETKTLNPMNNNVKTYGSYIFSDNEDVKFTPKSDGIELTIPKLTSLATSESLDNHINNKNNPHNVTKSQIGLENVDNTSDLNKPISKLVQQALDLKQNSTDNSLETDNKTISGSINELLSLLNSINDKISKFKLQYKNNNSLNLAVGTKFKFQLKEFVDIGSVMTIDENYDYTNSENGYKITGTNDKNETISLGSIDGWFGFTINGIQYVYLNQKYLEMFGKELGMTNEGYKGDGWYTMELKIEDSSFTYDFVKIDYSEICEPFIITISELENTVYGSDQVTELSTKDLSFIINSIEIINE